MKKVLFALWLVGILQVSWGQKLMKVNVAAFEKQLQRKGVQLIDVRTPEEYVEEHLPKSININWLGDQFDSQVKQLRKDQPVLVYCKMGGRSAQAAQRLSALGFVKVVDLEGGIMAWKAAGKLKTKALKGRRWADVQKELQVHDIAVLNLYAPWCGPCKKMAPYMNRLTQKHPQIHLIRLNADEHPNLIDDMQLEGVPLTMVYRKGKEVFKKQGFVAEKELLKSCQ